MRDVVRRELLEILGAGLIYLVVSFMIVVDAIRKRDVHSLIVLHTILVGFFVAGEYTRLKNGVFVLGRFRPRVKIENSLVWAVSIIAALVSSFISPWLNRLAFGP